MNVRDITVVAVGGNSLLAPGQPPTVPNQFAVTARAMVPVADLVEMGMKVVLTHGNGPQVGFMQLRSELSAKIIHEVPLDSLVADTQGSLGYMIQRALREELIRRHLDARVVSVVTEVEVDPDDSAFKEPTKPIGRFYTQEEADFLRQERGWKMMEDAGRGYRRVVPSPSPIKINQLDSIDCLVRSGFTVVCCGGGGIPITQTWDEHIIGLEAVIDKDRASALLAIALNAKRLIITTATDAVYRDFLTEHRTRLPRLNVEEVLALEAEGQFPPGSMAPKMEAAVHFLKNGGDEVVICSPEDLALAARGKTGTTIRKD